MTPGRAPRYDPRRTRSNRAEEGIEGPKVRRPPLLTRREALILAGLLVMTWTVRVLRPDQPIVENYVGRQIPTAMVARNLERGSGFLWPRLDTAPLPNLFLVEPPIYAQAVVWVHRATGLALEPAGRLVSALALTLGGWGLFGLVRRREGTFVALLSVAAWVVFPVTIRYGRAFQPDAFMLGTLVAGMRCWDEHESGGGRWELVAGWTLLATGLAVKVIAAYILVPLIAVILCPRRAWKVALALSALLPAVFWYVHAAALLAEGVGSHASAENGAIWARALIPAALFRSATFGFLIRYLVIRAFTPLGFVLAVTGLLARPDPHRLWWVWGGSAFAALAVLAGKLHHEYYWMALAPVAAVGVGKSLALLADGSRALATASACGVFVLSLLQVASTWRTPPGWVHLPEAARAVRASVPSGAWVVAPEALLYAADRRGCRLEFSRGARLRAAGEWGKSTLSNDPLALVEFYRARGARYVADVGLGRDGDTERRALHEAIRQRYNVLRDSRGVLLAELTDPEGAPHGRR